MSPLARVSAVKWWAESAYLQLVAFLHSSPHSQCLFCSSSILKSCCWLSRWALFFQSPFFSSVHLFVPLLFSSCCLFSQQADLHLHSCWCSSLNSPVVMHQDVLTLPCRGQTLYTVSGSWRLPEQNVPGDRNTWFLPSPLTSVCMYYKTWSYWSIIQSVYVWFPSLHVEFWAAVGGLCSSLVGRWTLWMSSGEVLTYIKPPRMISAGSEGSKGNT